MIRRPPRSTQSRSSAASDVYKRQEIIKAVRKEITVPLAVGGGIRTSEEAREIYEAGADLIILGNGCEKDLRLLNEACKLRDDLISK